MSVGDECYKGKVQLQWCALYTKPRKECQVCSFLEEEGYKVYLPTIPVRRRGRVVTVPFFSCYLFARLNGALDFSAVRWTPGLRRIVTFGDQTAVVPDDVISFLRERLATLRESHCPVPRFKRGDRVRIRCGPFADFEGVFEQGLTSRDRAKILVDFLGQWTRCEVDIDSIKRVH